MAIIRFTAGGAVCGTNGGTNDADDDDDDGVEDDDDADADADDEEEAAACCVAAVDGSGNVEDVEEAVPAALFGFGFVEF